MLKGAFRNGARFANGTVFPAAIELIEEFSLFSLENRLRVEIIVGLEFVFLIFLIWEEALFSSAARFFPCVVDACKGVRDCWKGAQEGCKRAQGCRGAREGCGGAREGCIGEREGCRRAREGCKDAGLWLRTMLF